MFRGFGWTELLIVLGIVLLIFGPAKLPQLGKAMGRTIREFRQSISGAGQKAADEPNRGDQD